MIDRLPRDIQRVLGDAPIHEIDVGMTAARLCSIGDRILKVEATHEESNNEYRMIQWLQGQVPVPTVHSFVQEDGYNYLLMSRLPGTMAFESPIIDNPTNMVRLLAKGLRMLWKIPIKDCPYRNDINHKLALAEQRLSHDLIDLDDVDERLFTSGRFASLRDALNWLKTHRPSEDLVFSHGDYCLPNILMTEEEVTGFVDLGRAGIADKWQDIALCIRSMSYNLGDKFDSQYVDQFMKELDVEYDEHKLDYFILLDEFF